MPDLQFNSSSEPEHYDIDSDVSQDISDLLPNKQHLHKKFITTLQKVLPHLGKDEEKIISALIILALKLEGIIGKDLSDADSKMIEILKDSIENNSEKKDSVMKIAERFNMPD
tara:strand:- start:388 stop:726 length:339 start_codon:yes stop_codon:yes gene_type:complete